MDRTIRVYWKNQTSGWLNYTWRGVMRGDSVIHISASEAIYDYNTPSLSGPLQNMSFYKGDFPVYVKNVSPHWYNDGTAGCNFWLQIDGTNSLNIITDITVFDPLEQGDTFPPNL